MKNFDLDTHLRVSRAPERSDEYWADFPGRVTREVRSRPLPRPARSSWLPQLAWGFSLAFGCFALGYFIGHDGVPKSVSHALLENQHEIRMSVVTFPQHLRTFMQDEHGLQKLVPDQP